jgi:heme oxygenase (biliverdin-producing, ferredoxin)
VVCGDSLRRWSVAAARKAAALVCSRSWQGRGGYIAPTMSEPPPPTLAQRLKTATAAEHHRVERSGIMPALLRGQIGRAGYVALLRNLHAIYAALEPALLRHAGRAAVGPVVLPELFRRAAIEADLAALGAAAEASAVALAPATAQYVQRLRDIDVAQPGLLVAHAYVRYLGDLSGGQQLRRIVARSLGLHGAAGTSFYDFGDAGRVQALAQRLRAGLDAVGGLADDADAVVAEAESAFGRHRQLFEQLSGQQSGQLFEQQAAAGG